MNSSFFPSDSHPLSASQSDSLETLDRSHPIPSPSHPRQYRAIGLIRGQYQPEPDKLTKGILKSTDGTAFQAVLLGRVMSLVKKHLDLNQEHLWVVYPRNRQEDDSLHLQIVGVWEPETLNVSQSSELNSETISPVADGYFSIRGEVVFSSVENQVVVVKIRQTPKKPNEKPKFFKIKLKGSLTNRPIGHFWDLHTQLEDNRLLIKEAHDLGLVKTKPKKSVDKAKGRKPLPKTASEKPLQTPTESKQDQKVPVVRPKPILSRRPPQQS